MFRPLQADIIEAVLAKKDTLAILPTGGGKSICFQVPALMQEGLCLVVSPLIALMNDQVQNLAKKNITALAIYAGMGYIEVKKTLQRAAFNDCKFLYVSPERLETALFLEFLPALPISIIAVDEAHCISQWGYDFRPPYLRVADIRKELKHVPVIALTASATLHVQDDICKRLNFAEGHVTFKQSFARPNLSYSVFNPASKQVKLLEILKNVPGGALVYCKSRRQTQQVNELLQLNGMIANYYHAGLPTAIRTLHQAKWLSGETRVIVCTNAFGMGIDKADVRAVVHYDIPDCLENYYQEAGRAGRDGHKAYAVLLHNAQETESLLQQVEVRFPSPQAIKEIYIHLMNFLQVAAGTGAYKNFDFDIAIFSENFKLNILEATFGIQALAKDDVLSYNEVFFKPSTLVFSCSKDDLADYEKNKPQHTVLIKGLLRSYEGVFDFPVTIYESFLAKFLKQPVDQVKHELATLHKDRMVHYEPQKDTPQIFLLKDRMYADDFSFNLQQHLERKQTYENRVKEMIYYVADKKICRSQLINQYFGESNTALCNICDNCLQNKARLFSEAAFKIIFNKIMEMLKEQETNIASLEKKFSTLQKTNFWKVMDYLAAENKIITDCDGMVSLRV